MVFPQSYSWVKALLLFAYFTTNLLVHKQRPWPNFIRSDLIFYSVLVGVAIFWSLVGLLNGNDLRGIYAGLKIYGAWSFVFLCIVTLEKRRESFMLLHTAFVAAAIVISAINIVGASDVYFGTGILPGALREELGMIINFHGDYIKTHSYNIASLFFLCSYLLALVVAQPATQKRSWKVFVTFVLCLITVVISGRRALWVTIVLTPVVVAVLSMLTGRTGARLIFIQKRVFGSLSLLLVAAGGAVVFLYTRPENQIMEYFLSSFSADDERSIQFSYLLNGIYENLLLGSGFGSNAGYTRSSEEPWLYELSYLQMLYNFGVVGCLLLSGLFFTYLLAALRSIRRLRAKTTVPLGVLVGFWAIAIGAYSNPYFQYFDGLFYVAMFVIITSHGPGLSR